MKKWLRSKFRRKEWVANSADPTAVIQWRSKYLTLLGSWGVEATFRIWGFELRTYDNRFFKWLWGEFEDIYNEEQLAYDEDPMGRLGDYI